MKVIAHNFRLEQSADDGGRHSRSRHDHSTAGRVRMTKPLQAKDEKNGGNQVDCFDQESGVHFFSSALTASFLRNILSIRSVIRNPPVTLIMAEVTAAQPRIEVT